MLNKKNSSYKTTLLLDLGETVFIALSEKEFQAHGSSYKDIRKLANIHSSQVLSEGGASTDSEATDFYEQVLK